MHSILIADSITDRTLIRLLHIDGEVTGGLVIYSWSYKAVTLGGWMLLLDSV